MKLALCPAAALLALAATAATTPVPAGGPATGPPPGYAGQAADMDWEKARQQKLADDQRIEAATRGVMDYRKLSYRSSDGLEIPAYLFKPLVAVDSTGAPRVPAVIYAHGGQHGQFNSRSLPRVAELVRRGYVVLAPDYRSSSGYGQAFYDAADYGGREIDDMLAAGTFLAELPEVDPGRIAILGLSHGGYNTLMALIRAPDQFAAGVDFFGPTDLVWRLTSTPEENPNAEPGDLAYFAGMVGASLEEAPELYRARSPRFMADRIRTPLLILHGDKDRVVRLQESQWMAEALREAGNRNFAFHVIRDGEHGYPADRMDEAWTLALDFLGRVFGPSGRAE